MYRGGPDGDEDAHKARVAVGSRLAAGGAALAGQHAARSGQHPASHGRPFDPVPVQACMSQCHKLMAEEGDGCQRGPGETIEDDPRTHTSEPLQRPVRQAIPDQPGLQNDGEKWDQGNDHEVRVPAPGATSDRLSPVVWLFGRLARLPSPRLREGSRLTCCVPLALTVRLTSEPSGGSEVSGGRGLKWNWISSDKCVAGQQDGTRAG
jgi:hypothetical protein